MEPEQIGLQLQELWATTCQLGNAKKKIIYVPPHKFFDDVDGKKLLEATPGNSTLNTL